MPLTEKGKKIKSSLVKEYGHDKGRSVFYAMKNAGKISGVGDAHAAPHLKGTVTKLRDDDNQHMGFSGGGFEPVQKLVAGIDSLSTRIDAFESRKSQKQPERVKPRTKDNMQPSMPHPKEPGR